jgi:TonB family protein
MLRTVCVVAVCASTLLMGSRVDAQTDSRPIRVAVLEMGETPISLRATTSTWGALSSNRLLLTSLEESHAAARGVGYAGSLNMTLEEARDLGAAIGCDYYVIGDAQTLRRSSSAKPVYYEAYASIFIVSGRTGRLVLWDRPSVEAAAADQAEGLLLTDLGKRAARYIDAIQRAQTADREERVQAWERVTAVIEDAPDDEDAAARDGIRLPQPYRRLRPAYTDAASRAEAEATVDVSLDIDVDGEVSRVEIVRWAGFDLDEATLNTVRQLHFRPATRGKVPIPMRVLLRYNFRRPPKEGKR